jgi:1,4-dihydroxy-2-naphthoyl-CoA hydrolase
MAIIAFFVFSATKFVMTLADIIKKTEENELLQFLGVQIEVATPELAVLSMEVTPRVHQYVGIMNGGVSLLLCETAASIAAVASADLSKTTPVGIEINANHLRAVSKGRITIEAKPLYNGKTLTVWQIEILNDKRKVICVSRCTIMARKGEAKIAIET